MVAYIRWAISLVPAGKEVIDILVALPDNHAGRMCDECTAWL